MCLSNQLIKPGRGRSTGDDRGSSERDAIAFALFTQLIEIAKVKCEN